MYHSKHGWCLFHCNKYTEDSVLYEFTPVQVPLDHLCPPESSNLAPPLSPCQTATLPADQRPLADISADLAASPMERSSREQIPDLTCSSGSDEAEDHLVKKTIKRKKRQARKIPELTDDEEV